MYKTLYQYLKTPADAYAPSDNSIWTDAHISKQMLAAHLDAEHEGASRSHSFIDASAGWIRGIAPPEEYPTLLDVGCGPGLYTTRFAQAGYKVTGVDFSARSIAYARGEGRKSGLATRYVQQDYLQLDLADTYRLATFIYCDYGALSAVNRARILQNIYGCLAPGGRLLLDVFSMAQYAAFEETKTWEDCPDGGFWSAGAYLALNRASRYAQNLTLRQTVIAAAETRCFNLWDTYFTVESLTAEAEAAGFAVCGVYGDVAGAPYTPASTTIAMLLQK